MCRYRRRAGTIVNVRHQIQAADVTDHPIRSSHEYSVRGSVPNDHVSQTRQSSVLQAAVDVVSSEIPDSLAGGYVVCESIDFVTTVCFMLLVPQVSVVRPPERKSA